jgi:tRNA(Ile)-lysidine synthase TilS/MesJ
MAYCGPRGIALSDFLRWDVQDQADALDWAEFEARRCPQCGTHPDEWADDPLAYHAHLEQCPGCKERQRLTESPEAQQGRGIYVRSAVGPAAECPRCRPFDDD